MRQYSMSSFMITLLHMFKVNWYCICIIPVLHSLLIGYPITWICLILSLHQLTEILILISYFSHCTQNRLKEARIDFCSQFEWLFSMVEEYTVEAWSSSDSGLQSERRRRQSSVSALASLYSVWDLDPWNILPILMDLSISTQCRNFLTDTPRGFIS